MLVREDDGGVLVIGQQSHAWLSGQLARAWGNERFGTVEPWEEVCLGAEQHDIGWAERDLEPLYDRDKHLPRSFMDMPLDVHLSIWTEGPRRLLSQSRYAALLASLHGARLYERRDLDRATAEDAASIREFLSRQREFQRELIGQLRLDPAELERNSLLLWTWDYLSLAVCLDWAPATARAAPTLGGVVDIRVTAKEKSFQVEPWPFGSDELRVRCEGRRLEQAFRSEQAMDEALAAAPWEALEVRLTPG